MLFLAFKNKLTSCCFLLWQIEMEMEITEKEHTGVTLPDLKRYQF
jgi:hypothetical protein